MASDGGIFSYGDAQFYGSTGSIRLNLPIVGMAPTPDGRGYWLVGFDGGVFTFGDANFYGSTAGWGTYAYGMIINPASAGYTVVTANGPAVVFGPGLNPNADGRAVCSRGHTTSTRRRRAWRPSRSRRGPRRPWPPPTCTAAADGRTWTASGGSLN